MPRKSEGRVYVPKESFSADVDGVNVVFVRNTTRIREGHELLERFPHMFEVMRVDYEVEEATAVPGARR